MLDESSNKQRRRRTGAMSLSEMTTIVVLFHTMRGRQFKAFYAGIVCRFMTAEFPRRLSYARFVALMPRCAVVLAALFETLKGTCTGLSIADATPLAVCDNLRIQRNKVFKGIAQRGKSSTGWFYGLKLHAVINQRGELLAIKVTLVRSIEPQGTADHHLKPVWHPVRRQGLRGQGVFAQDEGQGHRSGHAGTQEHESGRAFRV
ncbi:transposase [Polaromonas hydrogenivorans]|uniref:Transposase n=1 Tax=Polaromonas hydrogenivorans TaxID=335476 RepID=A0AAU7LZN4_9BURK